ncbi:MAG TPA: DUF2079 domain-containing protein [Chroococcales cyanobacterium]|jgi:uncharacterized membrane protein
MSPTKKNALPSCLWLLGTLWIFAWSFFRHRAFQSGAFDLGIFDQALWLISRGLSPISSFMGFHILGDHAALILYPLAFLYKICPRVETLLFIQAFALASGVIPLFKLAEKLEVSSKAAISFAYLVSPGLLNAAIYDFHPEVFALPALLWALHFLEKRKIFSFLLACLVVLSCKEVLSLTVLALGFALLLQRRWREGAAAAFLGGSWFVFSTRFLIPHFSEKGVAAVARYQGLFHDPSLFFSRLSSPEVLGYALMLLLPIAGGLAVRSFRNPLVLLPILPTFLLNVLSAAATQRDLLHQYSLPVLPFLFYGALRGKTSIKPLTWVIWGTVGFLALGSWRFVPLWLDASRCAPSLERSLALIPAESSVVANHELAPHLDHRRRAFFFNDDRLPETWGSDFILIDLAHPGWGTSLGKLGEAKKNLDSPQSDYREVFGEKEIFLYQRKSKTLLKSIFSFELPYLEILQDPDQGIAAGIAPLRKDQGQPKLHGLLFLDGFGRGLLNHHFHVLQCRHIGTSDRKKNQ